jgi:hypothetical protein
MVALGTIHLSPAPGPLVARHGVDMARLRIGAWGCKSAENIVRRTIRDSADIEFVPTVNSK